METIKDLKNDYIDIIGNEFTNFVNDNYFNLNKNYIAVKPKMKKVINFPVFCFCVYRNVFVDNNLKKVIENETF